MSASPLSNGRVSDATVSDGTVSDGTVSDGTVSDGTVSDGTVSDGTLPDSVRLTIICSTRRVDLAVPVLMTVAELLTVVVHSLGPQTADRGAAAGGFILQRAGEAPLDQTATLFASRLHDGVVLYLRTRENALPEIVFDDVVDAVASVINERTRRWLPEDTTRVAAGFAASLLALSLLVTVIAGPATSAPFSTGVVAVLLVITAAIVRRGDHGRGASLVAGGCAIVNASACGATAVGVHDQVWQLGATQVLAGAGAAALVSIVLALLLSDGVAGFGTVVTAALLTVIGSSIAIVVGLRPAGTAATIAAVGLLVSPLLPTLALRLARLPLPVVTDVRDGSARHTGSPDTGSPDTGDIVRRTARADQYLTASVGGAGVALAACAVDLCAYGTAERLLAVVLGASCLFRARLFTGRAQRGLLLTSGGVALAAQYTCWTWRHPTVLTLLLPCAGALALLGLALPVAGRCFPPSLGRAADTIESLLVLAAVPLALAVMGGYDAIQHMGT